MLIGIAQVDYTPRLGLPLMGNFREDYGARGVHDPLHARAMVLQDESSRQIALLSVDIAMMDRSNVSLMRNWISAQCDLPAENILIAATHTHSGPAAMGAGSLPKAPDEDVRAFLTRAAWSVVEARENLQPSELRIGQSSESRLSFNRRLRCKDGRTHMNWEKLDPDSIVEPLGGIDPQVLALSVHRNGRPVAALVNFGLHPAILAGDNWLYSADFPGYLAEGLSRLHGSQFTTLFFNGCCGDVNHIDFADPVQGRGYQMTQRVGYMLSLAAHKAILNGVPVGEGHLGIGRKKVPLKRMPISEEQRHWCEAVLERVARTASPGQVDGLPDEYYALARLEMHAVQRADDPVETMAIRIGDVGIVGLPGEVFCESGVDIKRRSAAPHTLVVSLANDAVGYLPAGRAYDQGGYEVTPGTTRYQRGCAETLVDAALTQLRDLFC